MTLLNQIQDAAVDSSIRVADLLRRCKILAARLHNDEFSKWVDMELQGYSSKDDVPDYRILRVQSFGHFSGPFGSGLRNALIPPMTIPEEYREIVHTAYTLEPVGSLEESISRSDGNNLRSNWPPDLVVHLGNEIYQDMVCMSAWRLIPRGAIIGILDTVRTRILNFVLAIEAEAPTAGEASSGELTIPEEKVAQVFQTHIYGDVANIAQSSSEFTQISVSGVLEGDFESLKSYLLRQGLSGDDVDELHQAIKADSKNGIPERIGSSISSWIGKMILKASEGALKFGSTVAAQLLTSALMNYLGLPN